MIISQDHSISLFKLGYSPPKNESFSAQIINSIDLDQEITKTKISTDNKIIAVGFNNGIVQIYSLPEFYFQKSLEGPDSASITALDIQKSDNNYIIILGSHIWSYMYEICLSSPTFLPQLKIFQNEKSVYCLKMFNNLKYIITGGGDGVARLFSMDCKIILTIVIPDSFLYPIQSLDVDNSCNQVITGHSDGVARLWNIFNSNKPISVYNQHRDAIYSIFISLNNKQILTGSKDGSAVLMDSFGNVKQVYPLKEEMQDESVAVTGGIIDNSNSIVIIGEKHGVIRIHDLNTSDEIYQFKGKGSVNGIAQFDNDDNIESEKQELNTLNQMINQFNIKG